MKDGKRIFQSKQGFITTDTTARIAIFLSDVARRFCKEAFYKNEVISLPLKLTHQQIGEFVGALRETVTVSLNKLEKEGIIDNKKGKITSNKPKSFKKSKALDNTDMKI